MTFVRTLAAAVAAVLCLGCATKVDSTNPFDPGTPAGTQAKGHLRGTLQAPSLTDPSGLTLSLAANNKVLRTVQTTAGGAFTLDEIVPGSYLLEAAIETFLPLSLPVNVKAGEDVDLGTVRLTLQPGADQVTVLGLATLANAADSSGILVEVVGRSFTALTGSTGAYQLLLPAGTYTLRFSHKDFVTTSLSNVVIAKGASQTLAAVALPSNPATVRGAVTGELSGSGGGKAPLANATVTVEATSLTGLSDATGAFTLTGLPAGTYRIRALKAGYDDVVQSVVNLAGGEERTLPDAFALPLSRGGLAGKVTLGAGADASGIAVTVSQGASSTTQLTGPSGAFAFSGLLLGSYSVAAQKAGYKAQVLAPTATVASGAVTALGDFVLQPDPAQVTGVVLAESADGSAPQPLASVTASVDNAAISAQSGADGAYALTGITPGSAVVRLHAAGRVDQTIPVLDLRPGEARDLGRVVLALSRGGLSGAVALAGQADASGVQVVLSGNASPPQSTDTTGRYAFNGLPVGVYTVTASRAGFVARTTAAITVAEGASAQVPLLTLASNPGTLLGRVLGENASGGESALQGAVVTLDGVSSLQALTSATGDFSLAGVPTGSYLLRVHLAGWADQTLAVLNLAGGETRTVAPATTPVVLALTRGAITGTVTLPDTSDASGITVELTGTTYTAATAKSGAFRLDQVLTLGSPYQLTARKDGYLRQTLGGPQPVAAGGTTAAGSYTLVKQGGGVTLPVYTAAPSVTLQLSANNADGYAASEDPNFTDSAKGDTLPATGGSAPHAFAASAPFTLHGGDGLHTVYVVFFSSTNRAPAAQGQTILDTKGPVSPSVQIGAGTAYSAAAIVTLTLRADDLPAAAGAAVSGVAQMQVVNTASPCLAASPPAALTSATPIPYTQSATWTLDAPGSDGNKYVCARFLDGAGNASLAASAAVVLDTTQPANGTLSISGPQTATAGYTSSPIVTLTLSATDFNAGALGQNLLVRLANTIGMVGATFQPFQPQLTWVLTPGDGQKTVYAQFADPAGNVGLQVNASITLVTAPPTAPSLVLVENDTRQNGYTNDGAGLSVKLSAGGGPVAALVSEDPALTGATRFDLGGVTLPATRAYPISGDGVHTLYARYLDAAGNLSAPASASVTLITKKPLALAPALLPGSVVKSAQVQLVPPAANQAEVRIAGAVATVPPAGVFQAAPAGVPIGVTLSAGDGVKALDVTWRDLADNTTSLITASVPVSVTLDTTPPQAVGFTISGARADGTQVSGASANVASTAVTLDLHAQTDATSGIALVKLSNRPDLSDAAWAPFISSTGTPWTLAPGDGLKTVYALFQDAAGNVGAAPVTGAILLAATPPSGSSVLIAGGASVTNQTTVGLAIGAVNAAEMQIELYEQDGATLLSSTGFIPYATAYSPLTLKGVNAATKTVRVRFRNAARVEGGSVSASIFWKTTNPDSSNWTFSLQGALANGTTSATLSSTPAATALLTPPLAGPGDVFQMAFAQATSTCAGAYAGATPNWQPYSPAATVILTGGDGLKTLCVLFRDQAGNFDATFATAKPATLKLDTTPPTTPALTSPQSGYTSLGTAALTFAAATDPAPSSSAVTYQCLGGQYSSWQDCAPAITNPSPPANGATGATTFTLAPGQNVVQVRARDAAFNASGSAFVTLTYLSIPPAAPGLQRVRVGHDTIRMAWNAVPGAASYLVYYGTSPGDTAGTGAAQGNSPIPVGAVTSFLLTGLTPGTPYYVSVAAVDAAGSKGEQSAQQVAVPSSVNPRLLSVVAGGTANVGNVNGRVYLAGRQTLTQLDGSAASDGAPWLPTGRAVVPNVVAYGGGVDLVGVAGAGGDYLYVTGTTLQGDQSKQGSGAGINVVFMPSGGTTTSPVQGSVVNALGFGAVQTVLSADNSTLFAISKSEVRAYSLADPSQPALLAKASVPVAYASLDGAALLPGAGGTTSLVIGGETSTTVVLCSFDVTSLASGFGAPATFLPQKPGGAQYDALNDGVSTFVRTNGVFVNLLTADSAGNITGSALVSYDASNGYTAATSSLTLYSGTDVYYVTGASAAGGHLYVNLYGTGPSSVISRLDIVSGKLPSAASATLTPPAGMTSLRSTVWTAGGHERVAGTPSLTLSGTTVPHALRWRDDGGSAYTALSSFGEVNPALLTAVQGVVVASDGLTLETFNVDNPLAPRLLSTSTLTGTQRYTALQAQGHLVFAAIGTSSGTVGGGVQIFNLQADGSLVQVGQAGSNHAPFSLSTAGRWLYASSTTSYDVCDLAGLTPPYSGVTTLPCTQPVGLTNGRMLDARAFTLFTANNTGFGSFTNSAGTLSPLGTLALSLPNAITTGVASRGGQAWVALGQSSGSASTLPNGAWSIDLTNPASPTATGNKLDLSGAVGLSAGLAIGAPGYSSGSGPAWVDATTNAQAGALPFNRCASGRGGVLQQRGVVYATCSNLSLSTAVDPFAGKLYKSFATSNYSAALAFDGVWQYLNVGNKLGVENDGQLASGARPVPVAAANTAPAFLLQHEGFLFGFSSGTGGVTASDASNPGGGLILQGSPATLPQPPYAQPASDGQFAYVLVGGDTPPLGSPGQLAVVDLRQPDNLAAANASLTLVTLPDTNQAFRDLALFRDRLYLLRTVAATSTAAAGDYQASSNWLDVYDVSNPKSPAALGSVELITYDANWNAVSGLFKSSGQRFNLPLELAVHGRMAFITTALSPQPTPFSGQPNSFGLAVVQLGTARDGTGAAAVGHTATAYPVYNPTPVGDTLYLRMNTGLATFDLQPLWKSGAMPAYGGSADVGDITSLSMHRRLIIDGVFAFLSLPGEYKVYDLR
jgi:hypothetical protein